MHLFPASRETDEHESSLFFHLLWLIDAPLVGQDAILQRHEVDHRKFQPFGGVERHQGNPVFLGIPDVGVGNQCRGLEECPQSIVFRRCWLKGLVALSCRRDEFLDVRQPIIPTLVAAILGEHPSVSRLFKHRIEQRRHTSRRPAGLRRQFAMEPRKLHQCRPGTL